MKEDLTQSYLKSLLHYEPVTGVFTWLVSRAKARVGAVAGTPNENGYIRISIDRRMYRAHRLAWLYVTGEWPQDQIDHRDMNKANNAFDNLREANNSQNNANRQGWNKVGIKGVTQRGNRFTAQITINGKRSYLGMFKTSIEAHAAYLASANDAHGKYARAA